MLKETTTTESKTVRICDWSGEEEGTYADECITYKNEDDRTYDIKKKYLKEAVIFAFKSGGGAVHASGEK